MSFSSRPANGRRDLEPRGIERQLDTPIKVSTAGQRLEISTSQMISRRVALRYRCNHAETGHRATWRGDKMSR